MKNAGSTFVNARTAMALATIVLGAAASVQATTITFGDQKDAMIFGTSAGVDTGFSSGAGPAMFAGADGSLNRKRSLIQFDIGAHVPAGATITGVTMSLYLGQVAGSGGGANGSAIPSRTLSLFDLQQSWSEGTSGSPTSSNVGGSGQGYTRVAGDSGWDYADYNPSDPTAGKWVSGTTDLHGGNFSSTASATSTFTSPFTLNNAYTWSSSGMVADVQDWLDTPSDNDGWLLQALTGKDSSGNTINLEQTSQSFLGFWTRDGAAAVDDSDLAPTLTVTYVLPEPATVVMLLLVAPLFAGRRRRA